MTRRSAGAFCIRPAAFPETHQIKPGVPSLATSVSHLAAFAPTSFPVAVAARCDLQSEEAFPPSSASCVRVRKCLSRGAIGLRIIFLWAGKEFAVFSGDASSPTNGEIPYSHRVCADGLGVCCLRPTVQVNW